jgi:hypothetical protein
MYKQKIIVFNFFKILKNINILIIVIVYLKLVIQIAKWSHIIKS